MKVLLTGGSGFLGSHVAEQLTEAGHSVRALVRASSDTRFLRSLSGVELAVGGVEDAEAVRAAMEGAEAVIHAAGLVKARGPAEFARVNAEGTGNLLQAAIAQGGIRRFVLVSSLAAVGPSVDGRPVSVESAPGPVTHYGRSKLSAERLALEVADRLPVTILRPSLIYGPRDRETLAFFKSVKTGVLPYLGDGKNTLSVVYGADCGRACMLALTAVVPSGSAYFVDDGQIYVWREMLSELERAMGKKAFLRVAIPFGVARGVAVGVETFGKLTGRAVMFTRDKLNELAQPNWVCESTAARKDLGWAPRVGWAEGVRETATWYREAGWL
jgi:nucleoside-diphosphate-sugar epimerase